MSRNGAGVYTKPAGTTAVPNTVIESSKFNQVIDDIAADLNTARPIVAGGTGAGTVSGAQTNLSLDNKVVYATKAANYTALLADNNTAIRFTAAATLSLTPAATLGANWHTTIIANGGRVTIDPNASETINGASSLIIEDGQTAFIICDGSAFFASVSGAANSGLQLQGLKQGVILSNNVADAVNDIDISVGWAASDVSPYYVMSLTSGITKRLDAAWSVGSGNGGLDTGSVSANATYHIWLIQRSDTGVVDVLFSLSATAPTMPANYDRKRRIGSVIRSVGTILAFVQVSVNKFVLAVPFVMRNSVVALASSLLTAAVPAGIQCEPLLITRMDWNASSSALISFGSASAGITTTSVHLAGSSSSGGNQISHYGGFLTNTSQQIYASQAITVGTLAVGQISNFGWIDTFL